jgi:class 3 adenylate cyclase
VALARTQYVRSRDADIAYQVIGEGPRDIVFSLDWASHLEAVAEQPFMEEWFTALTRFARVLWFDMRGIGMSGGSSDGSAVEAWMDDLVAVMDAAGSEQATLLAHGHAAQMAVLAATTHPARVESLVLVNGWARFARADDYPAGLPESMHESFVSSIEAQWGSGSHAYGLGPTVVSRPGVVEWWARVERYGATPGEARARMETILALDVRNVLPLIEAPTLVVHNAGDVFARVGHGRYLAEHIPDARYLERDHDAHWPLADPDLVGAIEEFVTGSRSEVSAGDRVLATVLVVDVVGSTEHASSRGDQRWEASLAALEREAEDALAAYDGLLDRHTGDGFVATFDGPARAIRCAARLRDQARRSGLELRSGLHTGELIRRSEGIAGLAVHIGARVSALAAPGEVLVTRTVRDLVAGSGIVFEERGEHELKGVPDTWALYAVTG